ncbi:1,4-dihydroxy-2-naphthoate octaprenyltransferase [Lacihabitans soyangensis]|uniref:1,4-dihydroxy-2-naphthoate octaprenyltransferase n=1 Tax=Lacihabitans soyangensis TaxID=869394 RepID=A0AAE3GZD8_9BACT|nr:1,4-dihydroxy-2-naphthoate octaprenyltransferase [Lacihabitans soyangensis]MCP9762062.1 1,4-dihydroxy-2-naphthoate octaprenyltransferase [Lacihabitans soyangensis]
MGVSFKDWLSAARLRTLPLALSSIIMGGFLAHKADRFDPTIFALACLTTILLQVLSNFANDYGDTQNGADQAGRVGPARAVQTGKISPKQMFTGIITLGLASLLSGLTLIYLAFGGFESSLFWIFLGIGLLCILAAYTYTAGSKPYGYVGLGDVSVFIFFGIVGVVGSYFLQTQSFNSVIIWPGFMCGALATGVLNINNIRDINSDKIAGKITIPVRLGRKKALFYHWVILSISIVSTLAFVASFQDTKPLYLVSFLLIFLNGYQVYKAENPDPYLKTLALTSLAHVLLVGFSII